MTIAGIVIIVVGAVLIFLMKSAQNRLVALMSTETYTVKALQDLSGSVGGEIGKGSFKQMAEVKGTVECDTPLESDLTKTKCVYYRTEVERQYEETYYETNSQTNQRELKTRKGTETISSNVRFTDFYVKDETGKIKINPQSADIDLIKVKDSFEPSSGSSFSGGRISFGGFSFNLGSGIDLNREGRKTLGYKLTESVFTPGKNAFVLGEVSDSAGELTISKPAKGQFIISTKSEEELSAGAKKNIQYFKYGAIACFVVGTILAVVGLVVK